MEVAENIQYNNTPHTIIFLKRTRQALCYIIVSLSALRTTIISWVLIKVNMYIYLRAKYILLSSMKNNVLEQ